MKILILRFAILLSYYILGAFATTDIPRLLKGSKISVNAKYCFCPVCGYRIPLSSQLPVFSFLKNRGHCRSCGSRISFLDILPELFLWLSCSAIAILSRFSMTGYFLTLFLYITYKLICLLVKGVRETDLSKNLLASTINNILFFGLLAIMYLLHSLIVMS